jgi:hypothetical protein
MGKVESTFHVATTTFCAVIDISGAGGSALVGENGTRSFLVVSEWRYRADSSLPLFLQRSEITISIDPHGEGSRGVWSADHTSTREGCVIAKDSGLPQGTLKLLAPGERSRIGERSPGWQHFASAPSRAR